jgi:hypothetical protein
VGVKPERWVGLQSARAVGGWLCAALWQGLIVGGVSLVGYFKEVADRMAGEKSGDKVIGANGEKFIGVKGDTDGVIVVNVNGE